MEGIDAGGERAAPEKPALLKGGMVVCWIYAAMLAIVLLMMPKIGDVSAVPEIRGAPPEIAALRRQLAVDQTTQWFSIPLLVLSIIVAYGLAKDRSWSRTAMMLLLVLGVVLVPPGIAGVPSYALAIAVALFGWWYLYRKPNVVEYYAALGRRPSEPTRF